MASNEKLRLKRDAGELIPNATVKLEEERLPEDSEFQEFIAEMDCVQSIQPKLDHSHSGTHANEVQSFTSETQTPSIAPEYIKTELMVDDTFESDDASYVKEELQHASNIPADQLNTIATADKERRTCDLYPRDFSEPHMSAAPCKLTYHCGLCSRSFPNNSHLMRHLNTHKSREREFPCNSCEKIYLTRSGLYNHKKLHTGDTFNCEVCTARFTRKDHFNEHMRHKHFKEWKQFTRSQIKERGFNTQIVQQHAVKIDWEQCARVSFAAKDHEASELNHDIRSKELIEKMSQTYKEGKYKCGLCPRSFKRNPDLKRHLITHSKDRKREFACQSCERTFLSQPGLESHMRSHTGDTHNCEECGARFRTKGNLKRHLPRCNNGDDLVISKRYICHFCHTDHTSKRALRAHIMEHTGLPWKCGICEKKLAERWRCHDHIVKFHKITPPEAASVFIEKIATAPTFEIKIEPLQSDENEIKHSLPDAEPNAVHRCTPIPQTLECLKTELVLEEEFLDAKNDTNSAPYDQEYLQVP